MVPLRVADLLYAAVEVVLGFLSRKLFMKSFGTVGSQRAGPLGTRGHGFSQRWSKNDEGILMSPPAPGSEDDALKRWILDIYSLTGVVGFPAAYTEPAVTSSELKHNPRGSEIVRAFMLGDAFKVEILTWFLAHLAVKLGYLQMLPDFEQLRAGLSQSAPEH